MRWQPQIDGRFGMERSFYKAIGIATPFSLALWVLVGLLALQALELRHPGLKWHLKMKVYAAAGIHRT